MQDKFELDFAEVWTILGFVFIFCTYNFVWTVLGNDLRICVFTTYSYYLLEIGSGGMILEHKSHEKPISNASSSMKYLSKWSLNI